VPDANSTAGFVRQRTSYHRIKQTKENKKSNNLKNTSPKIDFVKSTMIALLSTTFVFISLTISKTILSTNDTVVAKGDGGGTKSSSNGG
jgi:hypothetical protein